MVNKFEVTLVGNDQLGGMVDRLDEKVTNLSSNIENTSKGIGSGLAGKENQSGLSQIDEKFSTLAVSVRKNVQNISDMVPPLKNFGELSGKYLGSLGKVGLAGGVVYGVSRVASSMGEMAKHAYDLDVAANNMGLSAEKLSMVLGAFRLAGIEEAPAIQSLTSISDTFNDILRGGDAGNRVMSQLASMGLSRDMIPTQYDNNGNETVIVDKLLPVLDRIYDSIQSPQIRHEFAKATGIDSSLEQLLRGDVSVQTRYNRAYELGLVRLEATNEKLRELNNTLTETSAAMSGWWNKRKDAMSEFLMSDGSVMDGLKGVGDFFSIGDAASGAQMFGFNRGDDAEKWRQIQSDPDYWKFRSTLGAWDKFQISDFVGVLPDGAWDKFVEFKQGRNAGYQDPFAPMSEAAASLQNMDGLNYVNQGPLSTKQAYLNHLEKAYGLPTGVLDRMWATESGRGKNLISPVGAEGPFQFMPQTGPKFGLNTTEDRMNFAKSAEAAARYLQQSLNAFGGDVPRSVASYNWGGAWNRWGGGMPLETQNYLSAILPGLPTNHKPSDYAGINAYEGSNAHKLANEFAGALNRTPTQITLRIENSSGRSQTVSTQSGAAVTTSMDF